LFALRFNFEETTNLLFDYLQVSFFTARPRTNFIKYMIKGIREKGNKGINENFRTLRNKGKRE
jgi:hypothetical protein